MPDTFWRCSQCGELARSLSDEWATVGMCPTCHAQQGIAPLTDYELRDLNATERALVTARFVVGSSESPRA